MTDQRCENCKHWDNTSIFYAEGYGDCRRIEHDDPDEIVYTLDYEGYLAKVVCRKDFGCVLWQPIQVEGEERG